MVHFQGLLIIVASPDRPHVFTGKIWVPKQKPMYPVLETVTLEPELEEALANASDAELCDIAGKRHSRSFQKLLPEV